MCVGEYIFTVDCQCHNVDIIFTDNETNSVKRRRVLHKRQLKNDRLLKRRDVAGKDPPVSVSRTKPVDLSPTAASATSRRTAGADRDHSSIAASATARCTTAGGTAAERSRVLSDAASAAHQQDTDTDSSTDEDEDLMSRVRALYTKDAFHKYIIAG